MQIEIRGHLKPTDALRQHVERRMVFAMGRFSDRVRAVTVWFHDTNGPGRGGTDKACQISIAFTGQRPQPVLVEEVNGDLYVAISRAAARASHAVRREMERLSHGRPRSSATAS